MKIQRFSDFLNEAKKVKGECAAAILDMLKKKPTVTMDKYPDESGMYSLAGIKKYLSNDFKNSEIGNSLGDIQSDKNVDLKTTRIKNLLYKKNDIVYWYIDLDKEKVDKLKVEYEKNQFEKNKDFLAKDIANRKKSKMASDNKKEGQEKAKESAKKAERKPGSPRKKTKK